jgi:integrase
LETRPEEPAEDIDLPRQLRRRFILFNVQQAQQFIAAISGHKYEALFALAITAGMRPSEYLALNWPDFDLAHGTVSVSKTLEWRKGGWGFEDTKRERSRRMIKVQNWVVALLRKLEDEARTAETKPRDLVFMSHRGGPIQKTRFVWHYFKPLPNSVGLPNIRP